MTKRLLPYTLFIAVCLLLYVLLYGHLSEQSLGIYGISEERNWPEWLKAIKTVYRIGLNNNSLNVTALLNMETSTFVMPDRSRPTDDMEIPVLPLNKDDLSKYPNWTFEDVYLRDNQQRQWQICPESLVNSEDPSFKKAFIPDIQLYLHRKLFNVPEWNRLAHFNNPFGFMSYTNYTEIKEVVDQIPEPRDPLLLPIKNSSCIRCAVVASGGILNGSRMGKAIDAHDYVFRVNAAVTKGYEEDVGNRTSVYIHSAHAIISSPLIFGEFGYKEAPHSEGIKYVLIPEGTRDFRWLQGLYGKTYVSKGEYENKWPGKFYSGQFDENRFYVLHPDFLRYIRNRFLKSTAMKDWMWKIFRPTNGAFALFLALHTCDLVDAYGFITEDYKKYSNYYVDRKPDTKVIFYANHDYSLEIQTWKKLHDAKIIWLYQRKQDS